MNKLTLVQFSYTPLSVPLASLYLGYGLEQGSIDFDLKIYPLYSRSGSCGKIDIDTLYSFLAQSEEILAIGCWSDMLPFLLAALKKLKGRYPYKTIILGGVGPSESAEDILTEFDCVDFIIKGCGIQALPMLIKTIIGAKKTFSDIDGLVYRNGQQVMRSKEARFQISSVSLENLPYFRIKNIRSYREFFIL
ncbi:MAG: hypothetical protein KKC84_05865, partial [Candidatus Omnitrophica bacterium]|nr:hypothetical protein [Candidatus Omnitrophota bacterium]